MSDETVADRHAIKVQRAHFNIQIKWKTSISNFKNGAVLIASVQWAWLLVDKSNEWPVAPK